MFSFAPNAGSPLASFGSSTASFISARMAIRKYESQLVFATVSSPPMGGCPCNRSWDSGAAKSVSRTRQACQWAPKIRRLPSLLKWDDFRYQNLINYVMLDQKSFIEMLEFKSWDVRSLLAWTGVPPVFCLESSVLWPHKYHNTTSLWNTVAPQIP